MTFFGGFLIIGKTSKLFANTRRTEFFFFNSHYLKILQNSRCKTRRHRRSKSFWERPDVVRDAVRKIADTRFPDLPSTTSFQKQQEERTRNFGFGQCPAFCDILLEKNDLLWTSSRFEADFCPKKNFRPKFFFRCEACPKLGRWEQLGTWENRPDLFMCQKQGFRLSIRICFSSFFHFHIYP